MLKGKINTAWGEKGSIRTGLRYDTDFEMIRWGIKNNYDEYVGVVMEKVDNTQEKMGNVSREMETIINSQKETLQIKSTVAEMKKAFDELIRLLHTAKERIREVKDMPSKVPKLNKIKQHKIKKNKIS